MESDLATLPELTSAIDAQGLAPDLAATAIRRWRDEARPLVTSTADTQEARWSLVDELDNQVESELSNQRKRATTLWATSRFQGADDLKSFWSEYDRAQGDATRIKDPRLSSLAEELNTVANHPSFAPTREERDMTGKIMVGESTLARYTTRIAGQKAEVVMTPDQDGAKPVSFELAVPTADEVKAEIEKQNQELTGLREASATAFQIGDTQANPEQIRLSESYDAKAAEIEDRIKRLSGKSGSAVLLNERIREKTKEPAFKAIGDSTWGAAAGDIWKGLQSASFSAAGLVSRVLPGTTERVLEGVGALPDTGSAQTSPDRAMGYFAQAQGEIDTATPGTTRNNLVGGYFNELTQSARRSAGEMLPYVGAGLASKLIGGVEGKVVTEALKAASAAPMGASGAGMGAGMAGGSYLESMRRIADAERNGDTDTAERIRKGMDAHAILTGALGATVSKMSPLHNLELSGAGLKSLGLDVLKEGLEEPFEGFIQRSVIDPATLGDHPDIFEPMAQEFGVGLAMAFPLAAGSKIIENLGKRKVEIAGETEKAKAVAADIGVVDDATIEALDKAHEVKIAVATKDAAAEVRAVASEIAAIDEKLINIEQDQSLDEVAKKDAREPLIKAKLDIYAGPPKAAQAEVQAAVEPVVEAAPAEASSTIEQPAPTTVVAEQVQDAVPAIQEAPTMQKSGVGTVVPRMPDHPLGTTDILDFVNGEAGLIGPPRSESGSGGDMDWKERRSVPPFYQQRLFSKDSVNGINEVAQAAFDAGKISDPSPDALMTAIFSAIDNRMKARADQKIESRNLREAEAQMIDFDQEQAKLEALPSATEVQMWDLEKGDQVTVGGEVMTVESVGYDDGENKQSVSLVSPRFGAIPLNAGGVESVMADAPVKKGQAEINTDFLPADEFTGERPEPSLPPTSQSGQESQLPPEQASEANQGQQARASSSSAEARPNKPPVASSDSPDARSIKNAEIDKWRAERGLPEMAKAGRKTWGYLWDKAMDTIANDPQSGYELVDQLIGERRAHSDEEAALLLVHFMQQENAQAVASDVISASDPSSDEFKKAVIRRQKADEAIEKAHEAMRMAGTEAGRALAARKMMVDRSEVPSLGAMMADRKITLGRDLSVAERAEVEANHAELTEAKKGADEAMASIESEQLQADNSAAVDEIANEILQLSSDPAGRQKIGQKAREKLKGRAEAAMRILREKGVIGGKTANAMGLGGVLDAEAMKAMIDVATYYIVEAGGVVADALSRFSRDFPQVAKDKVQSIFDSAQKANERLNTKLEEISKSNAVKDKRKTPAQIIDKAKSLIDTTEDVDPTVVRALHRAHIEDGSKSEADVTNKVAESLKEIYGREFTPDEVRRIHTQYGKVAQLPADEVSKTQRDIKRQQLLLVKIEALKKKQPLLATGTDREKNSHQVHVLQQELEAFKKATNYRKTGKGQLSGLQDRIAARLDTLIADTKDQILGNKPVRAARSATEYDADNLERLSKLKVFRAELRSKRSAEMADVADKSAVEAAKAAKIEFERRLAAREWERAQDPKRKPSKELIAAREARDQAAADYREAERSSVEWKTRELAKKVATATEKLDALEEKLRNNDTSRSKRKEGGLTNIELKLIEDRKAEIQSELADMRKREPMTADEQRIYLEERLKAAEEAEAELLNELNTGRKKEVFRREKPTSPELKAAQERVKTLRKQVADMRYGDGQAAFEKWAKDRITALNDQLTNGRKKNEKRSRPDTAENRAKLAEIKSLEEQIKRKEAPAKRLQTIQNRIEAKKKEIARLEVEGFKAKAATPPLTDTPEITAAKADLDALQKIEEEWHANDGERDNAAYRKRLDAAEKVLNDRMARGDFAPKPKKQIKLTPETEQRVKRFQEAQKKYFEMKLADKLAKMSIPKKILDYAGQSLSVVRTVLAGGEFSMAGRQGLLPATLAMRKVPGALVDMLRSFASEKAVTEAEMNLKNRPNFALYQRDKLFLSDVKDWTEKKVEEANTGRWARKIPGFKNFERANSTVLNILRANAYDALQRYHTALDGVEPTAEQGRNIARQVNIMSGRGEFGKFELARPVGSKILFSPGHTISRFQFALGGAFWTGDMKSKMVMARAYGKTIAVLAAMLGLAWYAAGDDDWIETDWRSSDFLKIKSGQTRIDIMAGMSQAIVFMTRMRTRQTKKNGEIVPLTGPDVKFGAPDLGSTIGAFGRSKLNPFLGSAFNAWSEKDFGGNATDMETELNKLWKPMTWNDIVEAGQAQGLPKGTVLGIGAMLGAGVSTYEPRKPKAKTSSSDRTERKPIDFSGR